MDIYPVIMCGGAGTRLWPASRPSRPKQFIPLAGNRSLFQETALRVAPLVKGRGRLVIVGGERHRESILEQLAEIGLEAQVLLEPVSRDSGPAMAAAAAWVHREDPSGLMVFVASDHHVTDREAFRRAVTDGTAAAAAGRIVTMGITPNAPSRAYGYIKPAGRGLSHVEGFVEKPSRAQAVEYIASGYLWNSGNFIVQADTLVKELGALAPSIESAARRSLPPAAHGSVAVLTDAFASAPKISIDYAVMEHTALASVLEVDFGWFDLGSWDSIAASGEGDYGLHIFEDSEGCLARAPDGMIVAALGVKNLAIIAEADAVLVCDLSRAQDVKRLVERVRLTSPHHLDFAAPAPETLTSGGARLSEWLRLGALPAWSALGLADGVFVEALTQDGRRVGVDGRPRVHAHQLVAFAQAGALGWQGPWRRILTDGLARLDDEIRLQVSGGRESRSAMTPGDEAALLEQEAWAMLALAASHVARVDDGSLEQRAVAIRTRLSGLTKPTGDLHLRVVALGVALEACLIWEATGEDEAWRAMADEILGLALRALADSDRGFIRGGSGVIAEPGRQFEWAWMFSIAAQRRQDTSLSVAARRLYDWGLRGVLDQPQIVVDGMDERGSPNSNRARLAPQAAWLRAALSLAEGAHDGERVALLADAATALRALWLYLRPNGLWHDKYLVSEKFIDEPASAENLRHVVAGFGQLVETGRAEGLEGLAVLSLG